MWNGLTQFSQTSQRLTTNPLYALSLGSRELFHSNFLAWLFEYRSDAIEGVLAQPFQATRIERERHNIDLILIDEKRKHVIAIENKVKDTAKAEQLESYSAALSSAFDHSEWQVRKVLLTLFPPAFTLEGWESYSYRQLGERIAALEFHADALASTIVQCYSGMATDLSDLAEQIVAYDTIHGKYWFQPEPAPEARQISAVPDRMRFHDTIQKYRASLLLEQIDRTCPASALIGQNRRDDEGRISGSS